MTPYWIEFAGPGRIALVPRPRGGDWLEDDLGAIRASGVDVLVSLLASPEQAELGLLQEPQLCQEAGIEFRTFPIADRETPESIAGFRQFVAELRRDLGDGKTIASHCRQSIGRASIVLACLLVDEGLTVQDAFSRLSAARGTKVPDTPEQIRWLERYAER